MTGFHVSLSWPIAISLALLGAAWIYTDASERNMETADVWAVGFFVAFFVPPIVGGLVVLVVYLRRRGRRRRPQPVRAEH